MLFQSDGRQYCWIKPGQVLDACFTKKTIKHRAGSLMVWGCVTGQGMGRIHCIEGIMCGPDYVKILSKQCLGTLKDIKLRRSGKEGVIFQQGNDPKHWSKVAKNWFWTKNAKCFLWLPSSPDMNIIEHVWDQLDGLVRTRNPLPCNELWQAIQEEWVNFSCTALNTLFESMPCHVAALLKAWGGGVSFIFVMHQAHLFC
jgi:hypothetical protein